ncbi:adventurous gliding motility lipoprotein CglB [Pyxidicoccus trucidator]|uniref:adventurous gliding motility lipoprotein CglB n=1 Tax=Pyxidicoccus trucidator TaxID=2709662 RepID=UPI0013DA1D9A|nr:adventurous gliding motility lipoprotein CglB [Pyxidicoccus trucidator]
MRAKRTLLSALAFGTCVSALAGACQTYDFEPVEPLALSQTTVEEELSVLSRKPNIMMLVDTSGSMVLPVDAADPDCRVPYDGELVECGVDEEAPCDPTVCPTRWTELQAAVPGFLAESGAEARFALTTYPETRGEQGITAFCRGASEGSVLKGLPEGEDDASLLAHANQINAILQGIPNSGDGQPEGGTPTSQSLRFVKDLPGFQPEGRRQSFVVLLTDGVPNCNEGNAYRGGEALCRCTTAGCTGLLERRGCLDLDASVSAVRELLEKGITTIVVGFGSETAEGNGPAVLDAMARAGGFARTCEAGQTSCGPGDPCDPATRLCQRPFFQAGNQAELSQALEDIRGRILLLEPCLVRLDPSQLPSDPKLLAVYLDDQRTVAGEDTWTLEERGVLFTGAACERIMESTPDTPVRIKVRAIRQR